MYRVAARSAEDVLAPVREASRARSWGQQAVGRAVSVLRTLYDFRLASMADMIRTFWVEGSTVGYDVLRGFVAAGWAAKVGFAGRCGDGRVRRRGDALELTQRGMAAAYELLVGPLESDEAVPRARDNRVEPELRQRQLRISGLYLSLLRAGWHPAVILDGRAAKAKWSWPDWMPVVMSVEPGDGESSIAVVWDRSCAARRLQQVLRKIVVLEQALRGGTAGWSMIAVSEGGEVPLGGWRSADFAGSVHVLSGDDLDTWAPRIVRGTADWLPILLGRLAQHGLQGRVDRHTSTWADPGPVILHGDDWSAYLCDLRGWDPARLDLIGEWSPRRMLGDPDAVWGLVRDRQQGGRVADRLRGSALRVGLIGELDGSIWPKQP